MFSLSLIVWFSGHPYLNSNMNNECLNRFENAITILYITVSVFFLAIFGVLIGVIVL